jgi:hypothetical protein
MFSTNVQRPSTVQTPSSPPSDPPHWCCAGDSQPFCLLLSLCLAAVLEVILSTLDRDLIVSTPPAPTLPPLPTITAGAAAAASTGSSSSSQLSSAEQCALLEAVGRYPAGHAPAAASSDELREAYRVLQVRWFADTGFRVLMQHVSCCRLVDLLMHHVTAAGVCSSNTCSLPLRSVCVRHD